MEKGSKFKTILTTLLVLILMVGCVVLGYFVRDKEWIMIDNKNGATTLTVANVRYAIGTVMNDFEKDSVDLDKVGASGLAATTADSYFDLSSDYYEDITTDIAQDFYSMEGSGVLSQYYTFMFKPFLELAFNDEFKLSGEFDIEIDNAGGISNIVGNCIVNENNRIVLTFLNKTYGSAARISIDFDFTDDSYTFEYMDRSGDVAILAHIEKDKEAFDANFDKPAFTRFSVIRIDRHEGNLDNVDPDYLAGKDWDKEKVSIDLIWDYDLVSNKYCRLSSVASNLPGYTIKENMDETEYAKLVNNYLFNNGLVNLQDTVKEELGIEE